MYLNAMVKPLCGEIPVLWEKDFMTTCIHFESGSDMLTSLCFEKADKLISQCEKTGKGRLRRKPDGSIDLIHSVWRDYGDTHTDLHDINDLIRIKDRIITMCSKRSDCQGTMIIIDWGCGAGHTLVQLGRWLKKENITCVKLYGYANEFHPDWQYATENITFILDVADNLPKYFKKGAVDFIYSIAGLYYLFLPEYDDHNDDMVEYFKKHQFDARLFKYYSHTEKHLEQLSSIMKANAELIIDLPIHVIDIDFNLLKTQSRKYKTLTDPEKYGEHAYVMLPQNAYPVGQASDNVGPSIIRLPGRDENILDRARSYG
jgi:hypothetical protein